jgi:hypothetical protein
MHIKMHSQIVLHIKVIYNMGIVFRRDTMAEKKHDFDTVQAVRHARNVEKRSIKWIANAYEVPIDTVRDWIYRERRVRS